MLFQSEPPHNFQDAEISTIFLFPFTIFARFRFVAKGA